MIHRLLKLARPIFILFVLWRLWFTYQSGFGPLIPVVKERSVKPTSRIAKVTVAVNALNSSLINRALQTHRVQNDLHGYRHYIAANELVSDFIDRSKKRSRGAWTKPAYLLSIIVAELTKPESERLTWVFWFDADTVIMNPRTPLEIFVPEEKNHEFHNVHLLMAANWDGLNSGVFALRVHPWSVSLLSAVVAYPIYKRKQQRNDRFRDQSAFQWLLQSPDSPLAKTHTKGRESWVVVPMRWFNSLPVNNAFKKGGGWIFGKNMTKALFDNGTDEVFNDGFGGKVQPWKVMQGDMVVHFAGTAAVRESWMGPWLTRAEAGLPNWSNVTKQEDLEIEAEEFWKETMDRRIRTRMWEKAKELAAQAAKQNKELLELLEPPQLPAAVQDANHMPKNSDVPVNWGSTE